MIRYNISGCPILCFRFCVSIPMRHFDDLKLHSFTHKLIFWNGESRIFPMARIFHTSMVIGGDSSWSDWKASEIEISVREHMNIRNVTHQCEILSNTKYVSMRPKYQKPKAYLCERNFSHQHHQIIQKPNALDSFLSIWECCPPTAMQNLSVRGQNTTSSH